MALDMDKLQRMKAGEMGMPSGAEAPAEEPGDVNAQGMALIGEIEERLARLKKLYGGEDPV